MWNKFKEVAYVISVGAFGTIAVLYEMGEISFDKAVFCLIANLGCCLIFKEK